MKYQMYSQADTQSLYQTLQYLSKMEDLCEAK